jgi:hypothetical protein
MSVQQLIPLSNFTAATAPSTPTITVGDMYYDTTTGLMIYNGTSWVAVGGTSTLTEIDAGVFDGIAPYNGGSATTTATQSYDGGTP